MENKSEKAEIIVNEKTNSLIKWIFIGTTLIFLATTIVFLALFVH